MAAIKFGTDGWRGVIADDFTYANARIVAHAIARYVVRGEDARKGILIGYDHRFGADTIAAAVAETISATGTPVWLTDKPCPTPAISLLVRQRKAAGGEQHACGCADVGDAASQSASLAWRGLDQVGDGACELAAYRKTLQHAYE